MVCNACNRCADFTFDLYVQARLGRCICEELHAPRRYILHDAGVSDCLRPGGIEYDLNLFRDALYHTPAGGLLPGFFNALERACAFTACRILVRIPAVLMSRTTEAARILLGRPVLAALFVRGR